MRSSERLSLLVWAALEVLPGNERQKANLREKTAKRIYETNLRGEPKKTPPHTNTHASVAAVQIT